MKITPELIPDVVEFSIPKFSEYNPRGDVQRSSWFRMESAWYLEVLKKGISWTVAGLWPVFIGAVAGTKSKSAKVDIKWLARTLKTKTALIKKALAEFANHEMLVVENLLTIRDVAIRTNERTNERTVFPPANQDSQEPPDERPKSTPKREAKSAPVWESYRTAYVDRYGIDPPRNAEVNRHLCSLVDKVGQEDAIKLAGFYVGIEEDWLKRRHHPVRNLIQDYQKFLAMMKLGTTGKKKSVLDDWVPPEERGEQMR